MTTESPPLIASLPLRRTADALGSGSLDVEKHVHEVCDRLEATGLAVRAVLPEPGRRDRLIREATALLERYPDPADRPPLFGVIAAVKDIFAVDGFATRGGSALPPEIFAMPEATCVRRLRDAGALILGKTVSTEFAYFDPGATANPRNPRHTPGGSSSGSAAAVAAGYAALALGTQTVGSVIRPASFCGVVGFKPTYDRIPTEGVLYISQSVDHVGFFTQDAAGAVLAASVLCDGWRPPPAAVERRLPTLGVPEGAYLEQARTEAQEMFIERLARLESQGCTVRRVSALQDIETIAERHRVVYTAEFARVHDAWFRNYAALYRPRAAMLVEAGREITTEELEAARTSIARVRAEIEELMSQHDIDLWVSPSTTGPAPEGLGATGDPAMNLPWTHAGLPTVTLPAGTAAAGLPLGLQIAGRSGTDEALLAWAQDLEALL